MTETDVRSWYRAICKLPAAMECDAELVVWPGPLIIDDDPDELVFGCQLTDGNLICVAASTDPHETIATILHEVAHFAQIQRHTRPHGYSWRRKMRDLTIELVGIDPLPLAREYRRLNPWLSRWVALDRAVAAAVMTALFVCGEIPRRMAA